MAVVVNTIQAQPRWAAAHVGEEGGVAVLPALADDDATGSVMFEITVARVVVATSHIEPCRVLGGAFLTVGLAMALTEGAATALRAPFGQAGFVDQHAGAAVTEAPVAGAVGDT